MRGMLVAAAFLAALVASSGAAAQDAPTAATGAAFDADRADILAMAGNYRVKFDMRETTPWRVGYTPVPAQVSGGNEAVRVIEDSGRRISLQHLLVVEAGGQKMIIKHWRQDWDYEPARVLAYAGPDRWAWQAVSPDKRKGRWSQTVYQVDDSPRYGGIGQWVTEGAARRWQADAAWRPLARRDAIRGPDYDRYWAVNRHQPSPTGWVHWQDNVKIGEADGKLVPFVQEYVLNTYTKSDAFDHKAADDYWAATKGYWAAIRAEWARVGKAGNGIRITEEADKGTVISGRLLELADEIRSGKTSEAKAIALARTLIAEGVKAAG